VRVELSLVLCRRGLLLLLSGGGLSRRDLPRLLVDAQPGAALLQLLVNQINRVREYIIIFQIQN